MPFDTPSAFYYMKKHRDVFIALDEHLLEAFNRRSEEAFCRVYEHFYDELFYFASKLFADTTVSPYDVLQDLFLKVWEGDKQFDSFDFLKSYLYLSVRNRWKNDLEHAEVVREYMREYAAEAEDGHVLAQMMEAETLAILHNHLKLLPKECARVVELSLDGYKSQEIAAMLNISVNTVYSQKQKAVGLLRKHLTREILGIFLYFLFR